MVFSKLTVKGQVTIPKEIRDYLGLKPGDRVVFVRKDGDVLLQELSDSLLELQGSVPPLRKPEDFGKVREQVKKRRTHRVVSS